MAWIDIRSRAATPRDAVVVRIVEGVGHDRQPKMCVTVRPSGLPNGLTWWCKGSKVDVQLGTGEHQGKLRVAPGTEFTLISWGGGKSVTAPLVRVPLPPGIPPIKRHAPAPAFRIDTDGALIVNLPDWLIQPAAPGKAPAPFRTSATASDHARARAA